ncbi:MULTISPECIES: hypothetical protein [unclassified Sphingomonas]|uniref:hypothetical protein n=1 Tax=unclassified Sphingomonas TaxID=196159 RepID=UPI00226A2786|nr:MULTISPECIES: hypothetical protein [unclassified Sphingomonas]
MARAVTIYALLAEEEADPSFYPTAKLARQAFDWLVEEGGEPTIRRIKVPLTRQGLCDALNDWPSL